MKFLYKSCLLDSLELDTSIPTQLNQLSVPVTYSWHMMFSYVMSMHSIKTKYLIFSFSGVQLTITGTNYIFMYFKVRYFNIVKIIIIQINHTYDNIFILLLNC